MALVLQTNVQDTCSGVRVGALFRNQASVLSDCSPFVSKFQLMCIILPIKKAEKTIFIKCCV